MELAKNRNIYNTKDERNVIYQHRPTLYSHYIIPFWAILSILLTYISIDKGIIPDYDSGHPVMGTVAIVILILNIIYFFIVTQSLMYVIVYQSIKRKEAKVEKRTLALPFPNTKEWSNLLRTHHTQPKIALIYCTYNDFLPDCLYQCMTSQTYPVDVKILDDSSKKEYRERVDRFAQLHPNRVQVIRRKKHSWDKNKAGNLNHGLEAIYNQHYDFYIFLDSDELLEPDFTKKMLKEFYYGDVNGYHVGLIQATHHSGRNTNKFMDLNALSAKYFWNTQNVVRSSESGIRVFNGKYNKPSIEYKGASIASNLGHGCMADAYALYESKLFPDVVSEDVASTVSMLFNGWNTYFASQIHGNEETISDMVAMKIRCSKFANGDYQWCKRYYKPIRKSKLFSKTQKLDMVYLMGSTNIGGFLYCSVLAYSVWFPLENSLVGTSLVFLIPLIFFLYNNGIIDTIYTLKRMNGISTLKREFEILATYSSTYFLAVKATYQQMFLHKEAKFNVTPKATTKVRFRDALKDNDGEMIFSLLTIIVAFIFSGWMTWMILLAYVPPLFAPFAELMCNYQTKKQKKIQKVFHNHQQQALTYSNVPKDEIWEDWTV